MAMTVGECHEMIAAARAGGVQLTVGSERVNPRYRFIRERVLPEIGSIAEAWLIDFYFRGTAYYASGAWRGTWAEEGGGTLINQKVHDLDRLAYLVGLPAELMAFTSNLFHSVEPLVDTMASAALYWANGATGVFQASITDGGAETSRQEYHGDRAVVIYDGKSWQMGGFTMPASEFIATGVGGGPQHKPPEGDPRNDIKLETHWEQLTLPQGRGAYSTVFSALVRAARGEGEVAIKPEEARNAIELCNGITLSSLRRKAVTLPLDRDEVDEMLAELRAQPSRV
jgi:predicted dehydrogenase